MAGLCAESASTTVAVTQEPTAGAAAGVATGLTTSSMKWVLAAVGLAAVTGGTTLMWKATGTMTARSPSAPPAMVQANNRPLLALAQPATPAQPTAAPVETRPAPAFAPPVARPIPALAQPERRLVPRRARAHLPDRASPAVEPAPVRTAPAAAGPVPSDKRPARITDRARATGHTVEEEVDDEIPLIERAHRALANAPALALSLTEEHTRRFPQSSLDQERELIAITALVQLGRQSHAREQALHFANRHPNSAYSGQIQKLINAEER